MFHGVIHKITVAQFFFETRCSGSLGVEPPSRILLGVRELKLKALCPFSYKRRPKSCGFK